MLKQASKQASKQADDYALLQNHYPQDTVTVSSECQLPSLINGVLNNLESSQCPQCQDVRPTIGQCLTVSQNIQESLSKRYCNGHIGVPITFIDKLNPCQFKIIGQGQGNLYRQLTQYGLSQKFVDDYYKSSQKGAIKKDHPVLGYYNSNNIPVIPYMRIIIQKIL